MARVVAAAESRNGVLAILDDGSCWLLTGMNEQWCHQEPIPDTPAAERKKPSSPSA
jgi:hypothetical protein